jgi:hypothetical protein
MNLLLDLDILFYCDIKCVWSDWLLFLIKMRLWEAILAYAPAEGDFRKQF